jgi:cephalosporin hydroxylase
MARSPVRRLKSVAGGVVKDARAVSTRRGRLGLGGAVETIERAALRWRPVQRAIAGAVHRLYYYGETRTWTATRWLGHPIPKLPLDAWVYQEIIAELRPGLIVETGTRFGGSALLMAHLCDLLDHRRAVSVDIAADVQPEHPRITYLDGSSTDPQIVATIRKMVPDGDPVIVVLDSDHRTENVRQEIAAYADLVTVGSYLIVEDTNTGDNPSTTWSPRRRADDRGRGAAGARRQIRGRQGPRTPLPDIQPFRLSAPKFASGRRR